MNIHNRQILSRQILSDGISFEFNAVSQFKVIVVGRWTWFYSSWAVGHVFTPGKVRLLIVNMK